VRAESDPKHVQYLASAWQPNVIVMDVSMPELDGYAVMAGLKADVATGGIPVILATARGESAEKITGRSLGAVEYLIKPFVLSELVNQIRNVTGTCVKAE
jgi:DNA-binding response OmpR family regulator